MEEFESALHAPPPHPGGSMLDDLGDATAGEDPLHSSWNSAQSADSAELFFGPNPLGGGGGGRSSAHISARRDSFLETDHTGSGFSAVRLNSSRNFDLRDAGAGGRGSVKRRGVDESFAPRYLRRGGDKDESSPATEDDPDERRRSGRGGRTLNTLCGPCCVGRGSRSAVLPLTIIGVALVVLVSVIASTVVKHGGFGDRGGTVGVVSSDRPGSAGDGQTDGDGDGTDSHAHPTEHDPSRLDAILRRIVDAGVTAPHVLSPTDYLSKYEDGTSPVRFPSDVSEGWERTPQRLAAEWLASGDPRNLNPDSDFLLQRYALATLWYGTNWLDEDGDGRLDGTSGGLGTDDSGIGGAHGQPHLEGSGHGSAAASSNTGGRKDRLDKKDEKGPGSLVESTDQKKEQKKARGDGEKPLEEPDDDGDGDGDGDQKEGSINAEDGAGVVVIPRGTPAPTPSPTTAAPATLAPTIDWDANDNDDGKESGDFREAADGGGVGNRDRRRQLRRGRSETSGNKQRQQQQRQGDKQVQRRRLATNRRTQRSGRGLKDRPRGADGHDVDSHWNEEDKNVESGDGFEFGGTQAGGDDSSTAWTDATGAPEKATAVGEANGDVAGAADSAAEVKEEEDTKDVEERANSKDDAETELDDLKDGAGNAEGGIVEDDFQDLEDDDLDDLDDLGWRWISSSNWMTGAGVCSWRGVTCHPKRTDADRGGAGKNGTRGGSQGDGYEYEAASIDHDRDGIVSRLVLEDNNVNGDIPPEVFTGLTGLTVLDLHGNEISGTVATEVGLLRELRVLDLGDNFFNGTLPAEAVGKLDRLESLDLGENDLSGPIPGVLGNELFDALEELSLFSNQFTGQIPHSLGRLERLQSLYLDSNALTGAVPPPLGLLQSLTDLRLRDNQLSGQIPPELSQLSDLEVLYLDTNDLTGPLPSALGAMGRKLEELHLYDNSLRGTIPLEWGSLASLRHLYLDSNDVTGTIPPACVGGWTALVHLFLDGNQLFGLIPSEVSGMSECELFKVGNNELFGAVPEEVGDLTRLRELGLENNRFEGTVTDALGKLINLKKLLLHGNEALSGTMPRSVCDLVENEVLEDLTASCRAAGEDETPGGGTAGGVGHFECECCSRCY